MLWMKIAHKYAILSETNILHIEFELGDGFQLLRYWKKSAGNNVLTWKNTNHAKSL